MSESLSPEKCQLVSGLQDGVDTHSLRIGSPLTPVTIAFPSVLGHYWLLFPPPCILPPPASAQTLNELLPLLCGMAYASHCYSRFEPLFHLLMPDLWHQK